MKKNILNKDNQLLFLIFFSIFLILFIQHSFIGIYFDDYLNAALAYGKVIPNVAGTNFNINQLMEWSSWIYQHWGGRLLYADLFLIPMLKNGPRLYWAVQSIVVTLIIFYSYRISMLYVKKNNKNSIISIICLIIGYLLIERELVVNGLFWASASILYIWPILPFMMFIYYFVLVTKKIDENKNGLWMYYVGLSILSLFVCSSQEQFCVAYFGFLITYVLFKHLKSIKKYMKLDILVSVVGLVFSLILLLAPGNFARMDANGVFSSMSFIEKIIYNFPEILELLFINEMKIYNFLLISIGILLSISLLISKKVNNLYLIFPLLMICAYMTCYYFISNELIRGFSRFLTLILYLVVYITYYVKNKKGEVTSYLISCAVSVFCLLMSPSLVPRSLFPYLFLIYVLIAISILNLKYDFENMDKKFHKNTLIGCLILILLFPGIYGIKNMVGITKGYYQNNFLNQYNDKMFRIGSAKARNKEIDEIIVYKLMTSYSSVMPYHDGFDLINDWIKEYYDIPKDVKIVWKDFAGD